MNLPPPPLLEQHVGRQRLPRPKRQQILVDTEQDVAVGLGWFTGSRREFILFVALQLMLATFFAIS